jgi:hypothetical protein
MMVLRKLFVGDQRRINLEWRNPMLGHVEHVAPAP